MRYSRRELCPPGCTGRAGYCGDGIVQAGHEDCDNGVNSATYGGMSPNQCSPTCHFAPYCGDGVMSNGEACDDGVNNGHNGLCGADCTRSFFYESSMTRDYTNPSCPTGMSPMWADVGIKALFPTSGGTYASVHLYVQVGDSVATLVPASPVSVGVRTGPPVDQSVSWTNFDIYTPLAAASILYPYKTVLRLKLVLDPTTDHGASPVLTAWRARYDCVYSQ